MFEIYIPYSLEKNIGKEYNRIMGNLTVSHAVFMDGDMMFLNSNFGHIIQDYIDRCPDAVLTCKTNRTHRLSESQRDNQCNSENVWECLIHAKNLSDRSVSIATGPLSMLLMVIPKKVWEQHNFTEVNKYRPDETNMLGVDNDWTNRIRAAGVPVYVMNGLFMYHQYRLLTGEKTHLL